MKTTLILLFLCLAHSLSAKTYDMHTLGADNTGREKCTDLINATIEQASNKGGGTIYFPAGNYLTGAIILKSNITLYLEAGATLSFSTDFDDYLPFRQIRWEGIFMNSFTPLLYAKQAENIAIKGEGTLEGNGKAWWEEVKLQQYSFWHDGSIKKPNKYQQLWLAENKALKVEPYYQKSLQHLFFRPPFIQFQECNKVAIEGVTIQNSPFWTINPVGCNGLRIHGITINNPDDGWNTDGINPSSCSNLRISDCLVSVGDDCITIKSGRDFDGREYGRPCENITVTNCVMLAGHGGVVIGSEMSGSVKNVTISNCVFNGTDAGIRLKASRGRGGVVENIRVDNIVMRNIQKNAFIVNLFYDKTSTPEPVTERTPVFRNIHITNVTGTDIKCAGFIRGIEEMPVSELSFSNINLDVEDGFTAEAATNIRFDKVSVTTAQGPSFELTKCNGVVLNDVGTKTPHEKSAIVAVRESKNILLNNCYLPIPADIFLLIDQSDVIWGNNFLKLVREPIRTSSLNQ
ncbi:glycoside hydrolase family 28 protein [Mangrovibacterium marinum]|uniref:Polygalacturonase n=1 Tax=Mangrovibacterium marinum TaxID=1639118 RepID=A0A2T5C6D8_9BACT|nr:glycoside hydrolase family 28 protein [Mangrovibacterium marinum]PTN10523.1 polygalacturonase [Mangrovibacterium marinum]